MYDSRKGVERTNESRARRRPLSRSNLTSFISQVVFCSIVAVQRHRLPPSKTNLRFPRQLSSHVTQRDRFNMDEEYDFVSSCRSNYSQEGS